MPKESDWMTDTSFWDDTAGDTCELEDELEVSLPVKVDYDYQLDENGNPTLFVPNLDSTKKTMKGRDFNRVEFDQTASHVQHAPELGIPLPADFDSAAFRKMKKEARIAYAKKKVPYADIIRYQNKIGQAMSLKFGQKTVPVRGFAGERKLNAGLVFQEVPGANDFMMSIIKDNGQHVSTYLITQQQLRNIMNDGFWVLQTRPFS